MPALDRLRRVMRKPPAYVAARLYHELMSRAERVRGPRRAARHNPDRIDQWAGMPVSSLWRRLADRPGPMAPPPRPDELERLSPGEGKRLLDRADAALAHRVDLLGSGPIDLGDAIDWHRDFKSGLRFTPAFCRSIAYNDLDKPSDVKVPWELSRMQWLIPAAQNFQLSRDERYAQAVRDTIDDWITHNPYAFSVNWACTMDVALRAIVWVWFFQALSDSVAWSDDGFRARFLSSLYMHGDFVSRQLEKADINGNHYTADAAGLVFVGLFLAGIGRADKWAQKGWEILTKEIALQVHPDGVDFESSVPYHRLVTELFLYPAIYRLSRGLPVPPEYAQRLVAMGHFVEAYSRNDGSTPLWGDADDARTLPFRHDAIGDHRYLVGIIAHFFAPHLLQATSGSRAEAAWVIGAVAAEKLLEKRSATPRSVSFPNGGFYILRDERNHVFIDCGDIGLAGRGGHGHNDLLACEIALRNRTLIIDCGAYLYTADYRERNAFRSTAYHNTPQVDGVEIYRIVHPTYLWTLHNDATPKTDRFEPGEDHSLWSGWHDGYTKLADPVVVERRIVLDHVADEITINDRIRAEGAHQVSIPYHLAPGVRVVSSHIDAVRIDADGTPFELRVAGADWHIQIEEARVSPSYGLIERTQRIVLMASGTNLSCICTVRPL